MNKTKGIEVLRYLKERDIEAYVVGGYVRDLILDIDSHDIDITSPLSPLELRTRLGGAILNEKTDSTIKYGVLHFIWKNEFYEIATFRRDLDDKRDTEVETGVSMLVDAERRDFSINSMLMDINGKILDPTGIGLYDVKSRILRTNENPQKRFKEDGSRVLRAFRFINMGFYPDNELNDVLVISNLKKYLIDVSQERITTEFMKIIKIDAENGIEMLKTHKILEYIIPELKQTYYFDQQSPYHSFDLFTHLTLTADHIQRHGGSSDLILAGLLHDIGKPATKVWNEKKRKANYIDHENIGATMAMSITTRLGLSKKSQRKIMYLIKNHMRLHQATKTAHFRKIKYIMVSYQTKYNIDGNMLDDLSMLYLADNYGKDLREVRKPVYPEFIDNIVKSQDVIELLESMGSHKSMIGIAIKKSWFIFLKNPHNQTKKNILNGVKTYIRNLEKRGVKQ